MNMFDYLFNRKPVGGSIDLTQMQPQAAPTQDQRGLPYDAAAGNLVGVMKEAEDFIRQIIEDPAAPADVRQEAQKSLGMAGALCCWAINVSVRHE